ncbi:MAG: hypothetical protein V4485_03035 [Pseudomonadota bacterium]
MKQKKPLVHYDRTEAVQGFKFATIFIRIIAGCIGVLILVISRYAFVLYLAAMLPSVVAIFVDRTDHKCSSATICSFNLIGTLPYIIRLWDSSDLATAVQTTITDIRTWFMIYGVTLVGHIVYWLLPLIFSKLYVTKFQIHSSFLQADRDRICADWGIKSDDPYRGLTSDDTTI